MKRFILKYKWYLLVPLILFALTTALLIMLSSGPQSGPFIYQIH